MKEMSLETKLRVQKHEAQKLMWQLERQIEKFANDSNPDWTNVGELGRINENLKAALGQD